MRRGLQLALLAVLLTLGAVAVYRALARWREFRRADDTCAAVEASDWRRALDTSAGRLPVDPSGLRTAECRCMALMATGGKPSCVALLDGMLATPAAGDWLPHPGLTAMLVEARRQRGALAQAAQLAGRGADRYPTHLQLLLLESSLRLQLDEPARAYETMERRIPAAGAQGIPLRSFLASQAFSQGDWARTLSLLGEQAPVDEPRLRDSWFQLRALALAKLGRVQQLAAAIDAWQKAGVNPTRARAFYGHALSISHADDPAGRSRIELLREAVDHPESIGDEAVLKMLWVRYVAEISVHGSGEQALQAFDAGFQRFGDMANLDRADLQRSALSGNVEHDEQAAVRATGGRSSALELRVSAPEPGMSLLVSPPSTTPHDTPFESLPVPASGAVVVHRPPDTWPVRWVLRDRDGMVRGSGGAWPATEGAATAPVVPHPAVAPLPPSRLSRRPPSGRPRLFVIILDCGDWRFVEQGRARGELPTFEALVSAGTRGVLSSVPAFTAAAVRSIAQPGARGVDGVLGVLHQLGGEVAGLNFVGSNPLAPLAWVLPGAADLFATIGAGELRGANLLHSYGGLQVGRHGAVIGPFGAVSAVPLVAGRALRREEQARLGSDVAAPMEALVGEMAGDFDSATRLAAADGPDLVVLRVASLDLLTHGTFAATAGAGQDDGRALLYGIYRYIDSRLGELDRALDSNDVLVVMSDHGIHTALQHHPQAMFLASGGGVAPGRLDGEPALRGVSRMIADFFGIPTPWPATGVEAWVPARVALTAPTAVGQAPAVAVRSGAPPTQ